MKIGILTYHRSQNFGALLQAVALRKVLEDLDNETYFIDYWPQYHRNLYKIIDWKLLRMPYGPKSLYLLARSLWLYGPRKRRSEAFESFISRYILPHSLPYSKTEQYDAVVYGSDQIWRKQPNNGNVYNPVYFGDNGIPARRSVSYAASMGIIDADSQDRIFLRDSLSAFGALLVREESLRDLLESCGLKASVVLDPTLLLSAEDWISTFDLKKSSRPEYLLFYNLQTDSIYFPVVKEYAAKRNLAVKVISGEPHANKEAGVEYVETADPKTFVELFYNANTVITSSYHGLVFSLIFNKDFFTVFSVNKDRALSLLTRLGLQRRMLPPRPSDIPEEAPIAYENVNKAIDSSRKTSIRMLSEALNPVGESTIND